MQKLMDELGGVRRQVAELSSRLVEKHRVGAADDPISGLNMSHNFVVMALEQTSFYQQHWQTHRGVDSEDEKRERLIGLGKTAYIWSFSSMEFAAKSAMAEHPNVLPTKKAPKTLSFREIVKASADGHIITVEKRPLWHGANTLRNRLVHNNGYGDAYARWEFSKELTITMEPDKMIRGDTLTFPRLMSWIVAEYADWCDRFLVKAAKPSS